IEALTKQLSGRVRWRDNMYALQEKGFPILELGPHRPLRGFFKSIGVSTQSIRDLRSAEKIFHELGVIKKSQEIRKEQNVTI
ncbi:hypothetical protein KJ708_04920, partial [bacterium]|nr:hypothetical protein [bacterium]MBU1916534.1 hypothetical protein [bacterium]